MYASVSVAVVGEGQESARGAVRRAPVASNTLSSMISALYLFSRRYLDVFVLVLPLRLD